MLASRDSDLTTVGPGLIGFVVIFLLFVVFYFLMRSMTRHIRSVNRNPEPAASVAVEDVQHDDLDKSGR